MGKEQELIEAARNGDIQVVDKILTQRAKRSGPLASLRRGPGANAQDTSGFSALHHAAVNRHREIVELLLSHGASTNIVDLQGSSPLHLAAWSGNEDIVRLLLTHGQSDPNVNLMNQSLETALHMAAQFGHVGVVKLLLEHGANPVITNSRHETSLDLAAQYGRLDTVQLLLKSHPELLATYTSPTLSRHVFPHTPLHLASRNGHRSVVELLVKAGFEVNTRTIQGTALHEAALCGKVDVVKALLDAGIDVCVADSSRRTAVDRLSEVGLKTPVAKEIAELVRGALKKTSIQRSKGNSPLSSPHESVPATTKDGKLPLSQIYDNHSHSDVESSKVRHSYSPRQSPKSNNFTRDKTRRSLDVYLPKGPDFEKSTTGPPKKPPRRNLSASPTHPDFCSTDTSDILLFPTLGRNKSLDESVYAERWRKSVGPCFETSQSTDSIDLSPMDHQHPHPSGTKSGPCAKSDITFFYGLVTEELKHKSKSQHLLDLEDTRSSSGSGGSSNSNYVSVARIKLRDAKSEQNVSPCGLRLSEAKEFDIIDPPAQEQPKKEREAANKVHCEPKMRMRDTNANSDCEVVPTKPKPLPKGPKPVIAPKPIIAPKPKVIKRQGHSCDDVLDDDKSHNSAARRSTQKSTSMSVLSPTELDKDWEGITTFMNSLSIKIDSDGEENRKSPMLMSTVGKWLCIYELSSYESLLLSNGFDDIEFLGESIVDESSLLEIGMLNAQHRRTLLEECSKLDVSWPRDLGADGVPTSVNKWLQELHLGQYVVNFEKNLYTEPERLTRLWNDELKTVLEIELLGHRRRLLLASSRGGGTKRPRSSISPRLENGIDESETDGSLPLRDPIDLVSGVSSALKTAWRHTPETLIDGSVTYRATYVGSSFVQEFSTTDSIQKAISEIRTEEMAGGSVRARSSDKGRTTVHNTIVTLIVSASVVSWYNAKTKSLVSEHEVGSIQCTCQASDDLRHLALVTKDGDPCPKNHSCHVFRLDSVEIATEAILTLGQAFEVAYQLALSNRQQSKDWRGHVRSKSANQLSTNSIAPPTPPTASAKRKAHGGNHQYTSTSAAANNSNTPTPHGRSHSITEIPHPVNLISALKGSQGRTSSSAGGAPPKDYRLPRAESFTFSSQQQHHHRHHHLSRAPIVSKEEL